MARLVFMGSPAFAVPTLAELIAAGHDIAAVYTQAPKPAGRGLSESPSAVHRFAREAGLRVETPKSLKSAEAQSTFAALHPDVAVVVAYGMLLPQAILDIPKSGCLNLHPSLLPRWRGAAPIQRPVMAGDRETAAVVMKMEAGLDTGPMCLAERVPIPPDMTSGELHDLLKVRGADLMVRAIAALERGTLTQTPQSSDGVTYAAKITNAECRIDFTRSAEVVHNQIRGLSPSPGAFFELPINGSKERFKVIRSEVVTAEVVTPIGTNRAPGMLLDSRFTFACGDKAIRPTIVQRSGKKPMTIHDMLRGLELSPGVVAL